MRLRVSFISGAIFAVGLAVSGMTQPENVIGFLDFFGEWKGELALVMGGAVVTLYFIQRLIGDLRRPLFAERFRIPTRKDITFPLIAGAALFGIGWGLVGFCPGPAIASITTFEPGVFLFLAAMAVGMTLFTKMERYQEKGTR